MDEKPNPYEAPTNSTEQWQILRDIARVDPRRKVILAALTALVLAAVNFVAVFFYLWAGGAGLPGWHDLIPWCFQ